MILRPYQIDAVVALWDYLSKSKTGNPLIAMPTGTGKSAIVAAICKRYLSEKPFERVLVMTHVQELLEQNSEKLLNLWPRAPIGMYSAGLKIKQVGFPITFASVQSIVKHPEVIGRVGLVIIDEAHLVSPKDETSYQKVLDYVFKTNPDARCVGLTATPFRLGLGYLTEGGVFDDICYDLCNRDSFNQMIRDGYLCRLVPKITQSTFDLTGVASRGGEFVESDLHRAVDKQELTVQIVKEIVRSANDRNRWLVFAAGLDHARHVLEILDAEGISSAMVDGELDKTTRKERLDWFRAPGTDVRAMVNNSVLTTGFDCPEIDLIAMLRPTKSPSLHVQMLGRGTRPFPGKDNCLVLDFGRNTERLGPINDPVIPSKKKDGSGGGQAPTRLCPECGTYFHASLKVCPECGFEIPENLNKWTAEASAKALIAEDVQELVEAVPTQVVYSMHHKRDKPPSMEVGYYCGYNLIREWIHFELPGYSARKAAEWWRQRATGPVPQTTSIAVAAAPHLPIPTKIVVNMATKHPEVVRCEFETKTNFVQGPTE